MKSIHRGMIGNVTVSSAYPFVVYGSVRGLVSEHRTLSGANRSLRRDEAGCVSQGGYSDANVYEWTAMQKWSVVDQSELSARF